MRSQTGQRFHFDALVIGSGLAGLFYCLSLAKLKPDIKIALISKASLKECNSYYAQGGIACSKSTPQDQQAHLADTLQAGDALSHVENSRAIIDQGQNVINSLIDLMVPFDKENSDFHLAQEGGHSQRRIYHSGDETGKAIIDALSQTIQSLPQITTFEHHTAVNLINDSQPHQIPKQQQVLGAYILDQQSHKIHTFLAQTTILATGGAGKVYRYTTNPEVATGDGIAMAFRSGARVNNMEFYQFHPTVLFHPTLNNFLISEAVRGEGAILRNQAGEAFMAQYAPEQKELATRDVVARAIHTELERTNSSHVFLDITHQPQAVLEKHFPKIYHTLSQIGLDMSKDWIPVVPAAHYLCGGIMATASGQTDLQRLYAIGETACTGLHGANRLASNSLLEACATAQAAAKKSLIDINSPMAEADNIKDWFASSTINPRRASQINAHWRGLRGEMMSYAGIVRTEAGLQDLLALIQTRKRIVEDYYWQHQITRDLIELRNIILIAELIVKSALNRKESRGGHYREDYPAKFATAQESVISPHQQSTFIYN